MNALLTIADEDIDDIENRMGVKFDEERRLVIKYMEWCEVQACPGSGKTTALIAKLAILAQKIRGDYGLCVLSHTNVARDEIVKRLGVYSGNLFSYPNYIGTIQSFVDKFLAIPAMLEFFGVRPIIDDDIFFAVINNRIKGPRYRKLYNFLNRRNDFSEILVGLSYKFTDFPKFCYKGKETDFPFGVQTDSFKELTELKSKITAEGYITFRDAYALANAYITLHPSLSKIISTRFNLVFIDESQDTNHFQSHILKRVFQDAAICQHYGDSNQAIYSDLTEEFGEEVIELQRNTTLLINTSCRFSPSIAQLSRNVCLQPQDDLGGDETRKLCNHMIFLFDESTITGILDAFAELILQEGVTGVCKAVGQVGRRNDDPEKYSIFSYWDGYTKLTRSTTEQNSLRAYFDLAYMALVGDIKDVRTARKNILDGLTKLVRLQGIKRNPEDGSGKSVFFTTSTLIDELEAQGTNQQLKGYLTSWCSDLVVDGGIDNLENAFREVLHPLLAGDFNSKALDFIRNTEPTVYPQLKPKPQKPNLYSYSSERGTVEIEVDTIHGVKGQTHQATLVLETFWHERNLQSILAFIKGERPKNIGVRNKRRLSLTYVAMTRPTELLCLAMHKDDISDDDKDILRRAGWNFNII